MDIWFDGEPQRIDLDEVEDIIAFCAEMLLPEIADDLCFEVTFSNMRKQGKHGFAWCSDIEELHFDIELEKSLSRDKMISTICHEMVHVKQTARGELEMYNKPSLRGEFVCFEGVGIWNGDEYIVNEDTYYDLPWEIEAYGREVGLRVRYLESIQEIN